MNQSSPFPTPEAASEFLARVRLRCTEEGACLLWTGATNDGRWPVVWCAGRVVSLRRMVWQATHGRAPRTGHVISPACGEPACIACLAERTPRVAMRAAIRRGSFDRADIRIAQQAAGRKRASIPMSVIEQARSMPGSCAEVGRALGMSGSYVARLRAGKARSQSSISNIWAGLA